MGLAARCSRGHSFDAGRQGYLNLLTGAADIGTADTREMLLAREKFLRTGHFAPLRELVADLGATEVSGKYVLDAAAGTGYYLAEVLDRMHTAWGVAADLSKYSARRAAQSHARSAGIVCDLWKRMPLRDGVFDLILSIFSPRNPTEFRRVINPDGRLLVAAPTQRHLVELVTSLYLISVDSHKEERLRGQFGALFSMVESRDLEYTMELSREDLVALIAMGPNARRLSRDQVEHSVGSLFLPNDSDGRDAHIMVTFSVTVSVYRPV